MSVLGFLYPGHGAEDDYYRVGEVLPERLVIEVVHTSIGEDSHSEEAVREVGRIERLLEGASRLREKQPTAAIWACTSGSFALGRRGAEEQARQLCDFLGVPVSSTSLAFVHALRELELGRVAVAATYPEATANLFRRFLLDSGIEVGHVGCAGIDTARIVSALGREAVLRLAAENDDPDAEAVLLPDTALHTVRWLPDLYAVLGKPVLTANQVTLWCALRLAGASEHAAALLDGKVQPVRMH